MFSTSVIAVILKKQRCTIKDQKQGLGFHAVNVIYFKDPVGLCVNFIFVNVKMPCGLLVFLTGVKIKDTHTHEVGLIKTVVSTICDLSWMVHTITIMFYCRMSIISIWCHSFCNSISMGFFKHKNILQMLRGSLSVFVPR